MATEIDFKDFSNGFIDNSSGSPVWAGTGVFDELIKAVNGNIEIQYLEGRLNGVEYSTVYLGSIQTVISEAMKYVLNKNSIEKGLESQDIANALQEVQLAENAEKWDIQKKILENQLADSDVDSAYKEANVKRDLAIRDKQLESMDADIAFNESKKTIMEHTRKDNIRTKAAEQFAEFMKYISAANVVPGENDFKNMRLLINAVSDGMRNPDAQADVTTSGVDFRKP